MSAPGHHWRKLPPVVFSTWAMISWIRHHYMDTPLMRAAFQAAAGGFLVFLTGILIGSV